MTNQIISVLCGYNEDDQFFLIVVREGDEAGQYLVEGDPRLVRTAREIVATSRHAVLIERWLERYDQQQQEALS